MIHSNHMWLFTTLDLDQKYGASSVQLLWHCAVGATESFTLMSASDL